MTSPLPDAVVAILEQDPYVEKGVDQVLQDLGLPPLPHPPGHQHGHGGPQSPGQQQSQGDPQTPDQPPPAAPPLAATPTSVPAQNDSAPASSGGQPMSAVPDIAGLVSPLAQLAGLLGSGNSGGSGSGNSGDGSGNGSSGGSGGSGSGGSPTQLLSQIGSGLEHALQLGTSAMQLLGNSWQGTGQQAAQQKSNEAQQNNQQLNSQGQQQKSIIQQAGQTVAGGVQQITAVITGLVTELTALEPFMPTTIPAMVTAATTALEHGMQIITTTESQLTQQAGQMLQAGQPVSITSAPNLAALGGVISAVSGLLGGLSGAGSGSGSLGSSDSSGSDDSSGSSGSSGSSLSDGGSGSGADLVSELAQPLTQMAQQVISSVTGQTGIGALPPQLANTAATIAGGNAASNAAGGAGGGAGDDDEDAADAEGGVGLPAAAAPQLTPLESVKVADTTVPAAETALAERQMAGAADGAGGQYMPMAGTGAGAAMAAGAAGSNSTHKPNQASADYGDEMVGEIEPGTYPVVGEIDEVAPQLDKDQAFRIL